MIALLAPTIAARTARSSGYLCGPDWTSNYTCLPSGYGGQPVWGSWGPGHNCVSYVAWRLKENGASKPWAPIGNAVDWRGDTLRVFGSGAVNSTPAVGAIAWWGSEVAGGFGHIAYIESYTASTITVTEDAYISDTSGYDDKQMIPRSGSGSPDAILHIKDVGGGNPPTLTLTSVLTHNAPNGSFVNQPINFAFSAQNNSGAAFHIRAIIVAIRDPGGANVDADCNGTASGFTIGSGAAFTCTVSRAFTAVGTYTMWADWEDDAGNWHTGQLGPNQTFAIAAPPPLGIQTALSIASPGGLYAGAPISFSFVAKNNTGAKLTAHRIEVAIRGPGNTGLDTLCTDGTNATIAAAATFSCQATNKFNASGTYTVWADWLDTSGNWHQGQLGPNLQFSLATAPPLETTSALASSAEFGYMTDAPISFTYTVVNTTGSSITAQPIVVPVRGPANQWADVACNGGSKVVIAPGHTFTCSGVGHFAWAGTYTFWADWEDTGGNWHGGALGPQQDFTLAQGAQPLVLARPLAMNASDGLAVGRPVQFSFTVKNQAQWPVTASWITVPVRDPHNANVDAHCPGGENATVSPGKTFTCTAIATFTTAGTYTFWADWADYYGVWHQGQFGPIQNFNLPTVPAPQIASLTPASGLAGSVVSISGANFASVSAVHFNGTAASFTVKSTSLILATVPSTATSGDITVTTPGGTATSATGFTVVPPAPSITSFTPSQATAGATITISGSHLTGASAVAFNSVPAAAFSIVSPGEITAVVPRNAVSGKLTIKTPGGTATSAESFTFLPPFTVSAAANATTVGPGTVVTISGSISPLVLGEKVSLQSAVGPTWMTLSQQTPTPQGKFSFSVTESASGSLRYRVDAPAASGHAAGDSAEIDVQVTGAGLTSGSQLTVGGYLMSVDGHYRFQVNPDGNLSLMVASSGRSFWSTGTPGHANPYLRMQSDGNLVLFDGAGNAYWSSNTSGNPGAIFHVQNDAKIALFSASNVGIWSTASINDRMYANEALTANETLYSANRTYRLVMQSDGNLVLYNGSGSATWSSSTAGHSGDHVIMQSDGNLVVYSSSGGPLWASSTDGNAGAYLVVQNDGNTVIYNAGGSPLWSTTGGGGGGGGGGAVDDYPTSIGGCIPLNGGAPFTCDLKDSAQDSVFDPWREYNRECTSFVAWRLYSRNGFWMPFHDYAENWGADARSRHYAVDSNPAPGSVAWKSTGNILTGHVAWVLSVSGGNVTVEQYNADFHGHYSVQTLPKSYFTGYIHFKDLG